MKKKLSIKLKDCLQVIRKQGMRNLRRKKKKKKKKQKRL